MSTRKNVLTAFLATVLTIGLAACGGGSDQPDEPTGPDPALVAAQTAAADAATAAEGAVAAQMDNAAADPVNFALAQNAATRARTAATEAAGTMDTAVARAAQARAEAEQANAEKYAGMVADSHQANLDELQRQMDVATARTAAETSYMAAEADATKADTQATDAEAAAPGSPGAMAARDAATAARAAAVAAKEAHDAIMDEMTKAEADAQKDEAARQAGLANAGYMTAKAENDDIQTTGSQIAENNRQAAVAAARKYGGQAADNAMASATAARTAANAARTASNNANAEYMRAMSARTNSAKAKEAADDARAAYVAADSAADDAHTAYTAAKAAVDGVMDDTSKADADAARDTAEAQEDVAEGHLETAMMKETEAEGHEMQAEMYADMHVVGLLMMANATHITSAADPNANPDETEVGLIEMNRLDHVEAVNDAVAMANTDNPTTTGESAPFHGGGTVGGLDQAATPAATTTARYPYYASLGDDGAFGGEGVNADTGPGEGKPMISVTSTGGTAAALVHAGPGPDGEAGTMDDIEANFVLGPGLGDFSHEKYFGQHNDTDTDGEFDDGDNRERFILFTDLAGRPTLRPMRSPRRPVNVSRVCLADRYAGNRQWFDHYEDGEYDHDGNPDTATLTGDFIACTNPATCGTINGPVTGEVQSISGYTWLHFSDANEVIVAAVESDGG